jgi:hypothetical protein
MSDDIAIDDVITCDGVITCYIHLYTFFLRMAEQVFIKIGMEVMTLDTIPNSYIFNFI